MREFIVVEGLIGVGKTTLCRLLEREWGARLVLEPNAFNPFLEPFYADPDRFAFPAQMFYLISRWRQQNAIRQEELFSNCVVSDYLFEKDRLFAQKTLPEAELELYDAFAAALGEQAPTPDLLIYLEAPLDTIMARIAERQAPGETAIEQAYIVDLRERYDRLLANWTVCPVLRIDNRDINYRDDPDAGAAVLARIRRALSGNPLPDAPGSSDREAQPSLFGPGV